MNKVMTKTLEDANREDFQSTAEAKSFLRARYQKYLQEGALEKLSFPEYRQADEVNGDMHFGNMSERQFEIVLRDLRIARADNQRMYFECQAKINREPEVEVAY